MSSASKLTLLAVAIVCVSWSTALLSDDPSILPHRSVLTTRDFDAFYDFSFENRTHESEGVSVFETFRYAGCQSRGVLKISLSGPNGDPNRRRVLIDMLFVYPSGWAFNLADSPTNKGSGGDAGSSTNDAELVSNHGYLSAYLSQRDQNKRSLRISDLFSTRLTLVVGDRHVVWFPDDIRDSNFFYNPNFFALNGEADDEGPINHDLYLGVNKVVKPGSFRRGSGLCAVGIKYLPEY